MAWSKLVSMELTDDEKLDIMACQPVALKDAPEYPWGLQIELSNRELEKLGLEADCSVGDIIDLRCFARVVGVNRTETAMGPEDRVSLQITDMATENESDEEPGE
jgi:hypothetical protein